MPPALLVAAFQHNTMMSKNNYRLCQRMQHTNKKNADPAEALRHKRRSLRQ